MAREKATFTVDRDKLGEARRLSGARSNSETIDVALRTLIYRERLRRDIAAYAKHPQTNEELAIGDQANDWSDLEDDTDWLALYPTRDA